MGCPWFYWVLLDFIAFYWVLLGFMRFNKVLLGFTRFCWILLGFAGFYWVLQGFTGLFWVVLCFTGFSFNEERCRPRSRMCKTSRRSSSHDGIVTKNGKKKKEQVHRLVHLGMQQLELDGRRRALVAGDEVAELAENVRTDFDHVLVARRRLQGLDNLEKPKKERRLNSL